MLVTDNDYPRFYGVQYHCGAFYMVPQAGAHPLFQFAHGRTQQGTRRVQHSTVYQSEQELQREEEAIQRGHYNAAGLHRRMIPQPHEVEDLLAFWQALRQVKRGEM